MFDSEQARFDVSCPVPGIHVIVPHLPPVVNGEETWPVLQTLISELLAEYAIRTYALWFYTPLAIRFTRHLKPCTVIYDCMDELSAFRGAPSGLREAEAEIFGRADVIFTGGRSLYEAKKSKHRSVHCFPSSIDHEFFSTARHKIGLAEQPSDQAAIPQPRLGYCGVIDERMDLKLLSGIADARPDWHLVMIGPVVKIELSDLPRRSNIHYLGGRTYSELPLYMSGWDVGLLPFALNDSTKFISPTKTPEYLSAGLPVVSTPITDVVRPYGEQGFVRIAEDANGFVAAIESALASPSTAAHMSELDRFLGQNSWDRTWREMEKLVLEKTAPGMTPGLISKDFHAGSATSRRTFATAIPLAVSTEITDQE